MSTKFFDPRDFIEYAIKIWDDGETPINSYECLVPNDIHNDNKDDIVILKYNISHYKRKWIENGKTVKLDFYRSDYGFGACLKLHYVASLEMSIKSKVNFFNRFNILLYVKNFFNFFHGIVIL